MFLWAFTESVDTTTSDSAIGLGFARSSSQRCALTGVSTSGLKNKAYTQKQQRTDQCILVINPNTRAQDAVVDFTSMDSNGFTISKSSAASATPIFYLALQGGQYRVGNIYQPSSAVDQFIEGIGFRPVGLMLASYDLASSTALQSGNTVSLGMAASSTSSATAWADEGNWAVAPSKNVAKNQYRTDKVITLATAGNPCTTNAEADFKSFNDDGFAITWTTADSTAREILFVAFGLPKRCFDIDGTSGTYGMQAADDSDSLAFLTKMRKISVYPANSSTISGTVPSDSFLRAVQHKTFYANGRFWFFYSDGTNVEYTSSQYLGAWAPANTIRACSHGVWFSVWFDGQYVHYAVTIGGSSLYYRRGTPNADGTISWSQSEQTITTSNVVYNPSISVDSSRHPWIVYELALGGNVYQLYAIKSSTNDGTWSTASGFPALIQRSSPPSSQHWLGTAIPLTSDKMVVIFGTLIPLCAKAWDGSSWKTAVNTTNTVESVLFTAIPSQGDEVYAAFLKQTAHDIIYAKYDYATNSWGTETTIKSSVSGAVQPVLSLYTRNKDLYLFWSDNSYIYYKMKRASSGSWDANPTVWIYDASNAGQDQLTGSYQAFDGYISVGIPDRE